jgi:ATP-dependent helicase HrpB
MTHFELPSLPVVDCLPALASMLHTHVNAVLVAEPGSGKTTRVPSFLASLFPQGDVWVLLPKRMAAVMAAHYVASLHHEEVGHTVGYHVRYDACWGEHTRVKFVTEQMLLNRLMSDPTLEGTACVVFDEFHERSAASDVALALLRNMQHKGLRTDLHVVLMSATLDAEKAALYMGCEKALYVPGRVFPVHVHYTPCAHKKNMPHHIAQVLDGWLSKGQKGDCLVFLEGSYEIRQAMKACEQVALKWRVECVPLYGSLPLLQQQQAVQGGSQQRVIFCTNIAETSLTVPGVTWVLDTGYVKVHQYNPSLHVSSLTVRNISQASAQQRAGRAGRMCEGVCIRLYSEEHYRLMPPFEKPEIKRSQLSEEMLLLRHRGVEAAELPWFEPPETSHVAQAHHVLKALAAVDSEGVTEVGEKMLQLPLSTRWARFVVHACSLGVLKEAACIAAWMEDEGPYKQHPLKDTVSDSDILTLYEQTTLQPWVRKASEHIQKKARACLHRGKPSSVEEALMQSLAVAFADTIAQKTAPHTYVLSSGGRVKALHSSVQNHAYVAVIAHAPDVQENVLDMKARFLSAVDPSWLLGMDNGMLQEKRDYRWNDERKRVEDVEHITYGHLILHEEKHVHGEDEKASSLLKSMIKEETLDLLCDPQVRETWFFRIQLYQSFHGLEQLSANVFWVEVFKKAASGKRSYGEIKEMSLYECMCGYVGYETMQRVERFCPEKVVLKKGRSAKVVYHAYGTPYVASRLQDFFGMQKAPCIGEGKIPLVCHFEAPNGRVLQVTADVMGFWKNHYPSLRTALARRYPKHTWPENPMM